MPLFSVIIPSYNRGNFLTGTIHSVLKQTFTDFEILIIDDGSTDSTRSIVGELQKTDSRIHYFFQENSERGVARNKGLQMAKGELIVFLDSDDAFLPGHLEELERLNQLYPKTNLFATKFDFNENGQIFKAPIDRLKEGYYDHSILIKGNPFACNVCIRKSNPSLKLFLEDRSYSAMEDWIFLFSNTWSKDLYLSGKTTVRMNEHAERSMRFNQLIVERRLKACDYILTHFALTSRERKDLIGYTAYFCSIHTYLDHQRAAGIRHLSRAMRYLGLKSNLLSLFAKLLFGRKTIGKIKVALHHNRP